MIAKLLSICLLAAAAASATAADAPFGVLDITLGASYARLERDLDFHDIDTALARLQSGKPDLGRSEERR